MNYVLVIHILNLSLNWETVNVNVCVKARPVSHLLYNLREMTSLPTTRLLCLARPQWAEWKLWADMTESAKTSQILFVFVTVCILVGVSLCACSVYISNPENVLTRSETVLIYTNLCFGACSSLYLLHFVACVQMLVNFDGMHSLRFSSICSQTASAVKVIPASPQIKFSWSLD